MQSDGCGKKTPGEPNLEEMIIWGMVKFVSAKSN